MRLINETVAAVPESNIFHLSDLSYLSHNYFHNWEVMYRYA